MAKLLVDVRPDLAEQLVDETLVSGLSMGTHRKVAWRCEKGHIWEATPYSRISGNGCPYCSGRYPIVGKTDLATTHPDLAVQLVDQSLATKLQVKSNVKVAWQCERGHVWESTVANRTKGNGCPYCAHRKVLVGYNDFATTHPALAAQLVDKSLGTKIMAGHNGYVMWQCEQGHTWRAQVNNRVSQNQGCPYCSGQRLLVGFNDLGTTRPDLAAQLFDKSFATKVSAGSRQTVKWQCENGHVWLAPVYSRNAGNGCPNCIKTVSKAETDLYKYIVEMLGDESLVFSSERTVIPPFELDIYIPSKNLAIEFNGVYWHSEKQGKTRYYHKHKLDACHKQGISLINIWEDIWNDHKANCLSLVANRLGVLDTLSNTEERFGFSNERRFARKLQCNEVSACGARMFLDKYHIQGKVGATRHFGLYDDDLLVAVLSVRSPRHNARMNRREGQWEVQRFATAGHVVGGFTKLLKYAERTLLAEGIDLREWISFSDNDVSDGAMYKASGFFLDIEIVPDYKYAGTLTNHVRRPKEVFQKRKFKESENLVFKEGLSERELAEINGLYRCFDSGKRRWIKSVAKW